MKIALDIDGVVSDFATGFSRHLKEEHGIDFPVENVTRWEWWECPKRPKGFTKAKFDECFDTYTDMGWFSSQMFYPEAVEALVKFRERGDEVQFFTWRPEAATPRTLAGCPVTRCKGAIDKAAKVKAWGADALVDDNPDAVRVCLALGIQAFLFLRSWNAHVKDLPVIDGWEPLMRWIESEERHGAEVHSHSDLDIIEQNEHPDPQGGATAGFKFDDGPKPMYDLVPFDALEEVAKVYTWACTRKVNPYPPRNWENGMRWGRVFAALCRHAFEWFMGRDRDKDSNLHLMAHVAFWALALIRYDKSHPELDDRPGKKN